MMMLMKKILAFLLLGLFLQSSVYGHHAYANDSLANSMVLPAPQPAPSHRVKSYTTQNINVNKRPSAEKPVNLRIDSVTIEEELPQILESQQAPEPTIYVPQAPSPPQTIILEKTIVTEDSQRMVVSDRATQEYILGPEDKIKITIFGEKDLSGDYKVGGDGTIALPLIGVVNVQDLSLRQAERAIEAELLKGYLKDPSVSIEVQESRPFYIMGEVRSPGSYNYVNGMNVLQAVAISGGFTYRANRKLVEVIRGNTDKSKPIELQPKDLVRAGDIIFVKERFF